MVVLMEECPGVALKRKGAEEPGLFLDAGDGEGGAFPLSGRATKIRRLVGADHHRYVAAGMDGGEARGDVMMREAPPPSPGMAGEEGAVVVYDPAGADAARGRVGFLGQWRRLRPWAPLRAGGEWIRDMLRSADSRTVREMLTGGELEGASMAVVPWSAATAAPEEEEESTATESPYDEEDGDATAAMEVKEDLGHHHQSQAMPFGASCGEGYFHRWPQHCMPPPQLPAVGQASPVMWTW